MPGSECEIGVIGGSGFYSLLEDAAEVAVSTPYGDPSAPISVGALGGRSVAFVPRHGRDHEFPPHRIPYRANLWALHSLGVRQVVAPCAAGSLRTELAPGDFVVVDQLVDRTSGRAQTFYDRGAVHVAFADPYCPHGRGRPSQRPRDADITVARRRHDGRGRGSALLDARRVPLVRRGQGWRRRT